MDGNAPLMKEESSLGSTTVVVLLQASRGNAPRRRCFESRWRPRHERQHLQGAVVDPFGPTTAILYTPLGPNANRCHRCRFQVINITARQRLSTTPAPATTDKCWRSRHERHCSLKGPFCRKRCMLQQIQAKNVHYLGSALAHQNAAPACEGRLWAFTV